MTPEKTAERTPEKTAERTPPEKTKKRTPLEKTAEAEGTPREKMGETKSTREIETENIYILL